VSSVDRNSGSVWGGIEKARRQNSTTRDEGRRNDHLLINLTVKDLKQSRSKPSKKKANMGILGDGVAVVENLVPTGLITVASKIVETPLGLAEVATRLVEALAINSITEKTRRGRRVVVKRRNLHSQQLADLTNLYFRMADIPIRFWSKVEEWQPFSTTFLEAYGDGEVIAQLRKQLDLPGGLAWIWWGVRTNFTNPGKVKRRLENLSRAIAKLKFYEEAGSARVRNKRRPSISCQQTRPGMPRASSRTLAIKDRAKAVSPG